MVESRVVVMVAIGIAVLGISALFLTSVLRIFPFPFGVWDADLVNALVSTAALRCAVDYTASGGDQKICTCTGDTNTCPANMNLEGRKVLEFDLGISQRLLIASTSKPGTGSVTYSFTPKNTGQTRDIICSTTGSKTCTVKEFTLPHEYVRGGFGIGPLNVRIPVVSNIKDFFNRWVGFIGEPRFAIYYQEFDPLYTSVWTPGEKPDIVTTVAVAGVLNAGFGVLGAGGGAVKATGGSLKLLVSKPFLKAATFLGSKKAVVALKDLEGVTLKSIWKAWLEKGEQNILGKALSAKRGAKFTEAEFIKEGERLVAGKVVGRIVVNAEKAVANKLSMVSSRNLDSLGLAYKDAKGIITVGKGDIKAGTLKADIANILNKPLHGGTAFTESAVPLHVLLSKFSGKLSHELYYGFDDAGKVFLKRARNGQSFTEDAIFSINSVERQAMESVLGKKFVTFAEAKIAGMSDDVAKAEAAEALGMLYFLKLSAKEADLSVANRAILSKLDDLTETELDELWISLGKVSKELDDKYATFLDELVEDGTFKSAIAKEVEEFGPRMTATITEAFKEGGTINGAIAMQKNYATIKGIRGAFEAVDSEIDEVARYAYDEFMQQSLIILKSEGKEAYLAAVKALPAAPNNAAGQYITSKATAFANNLKTGSVSFLRGYAGIPTSLDDAFLKKSAIAVYTTAAMYLFLSPRSELFAACEGNALCLHTSSLISVYPKNTLSMPLATTTHMVTSDFGPPGSGELFGPKQLQSNGVVLSPCKSDLFTKLPTHNDKSCKYANTDVIAYEVSKVGCTCIGKAGSYSEYSSSQLSSIKIKYSIFRIELDTNYYLETYGRCPTSTDELGGRTALKDGSPYSITSVNNDKIECESLKNSNPNNFSMGLTPITFEIKNNAGTFEKYSKWNTCIHYEEVVYSGRAVAVERTCDAADSVNPFRSHLQTSSCTNGDYSDCAKVDFVDKLESRLTDADKTLLNEGKNLFSVQPSNVAPGIKVEEVLVNRCLSTEHDATYNTGWNSLPNGYNEIKIDPNWDELKKYSGKGFDYNYCMYNKDSRAEIYQLTSDTLTFVGSILLAIPTGGTSLAVTIPAQFVLGAYGAWNHIVQNENKAWPCYQGAGDSGWIDSGQDLLETAWGKDGCKNLCLEGEKFDINDGNCK